jgi:hypothetical protein
MTMDGDTQPLTDQALVRHSIERAVLHALKGLKFGSLEIIVHDSKIVRMERKEKIRLDVQEASEERKAE